MAISISKFLKLQEVKLAAKLAQAVKNGTEYVHRLSKIRLGLGITCGTDEVQVEGYTMWRLNSEALELKKGTHPSYLTVKNVSNKCMSAIGSALLARSIKSRELDVESVDRGFCDSSYQGGLYRSGVVYYDGHWPLYAKAVGRPGIEKIAPFWTRDDVFQVRGIYEGEVRSVLECIVTYCHKIHNPLQPRSLIIHTDNEGVACDMMRVLYGWEEVSRKDSWGTDHMQALDVIDTYGLDVWILCVKRERMKADWLTKLRLDVELYTKELVAIDEGALNFLGGWGLYKFHPHTTSLLNLHRGNCNNNEGMFIRELLRHCSDALGKIQLESKLDAQPELFIRIIPDKTKNSLSIIDSGTGTNVADLVKNLGTIARPGTKECIVVLSTGADVSMIGQFAIAFYSLSLVAKKVSVITNYNGEEHYVWNWESEDGGSFTVTRDMSGEKLGRGSEITLILKEDQLEYLEEHRLKDLIKKHSQFVSYPIYLWVEETAEDENSNDVGRNVEEVDDEIKQVRHQWDLVNKQNAIWMRKPEEVTKEEYSAFYKNLTHDWEEQLAVKHFSVEEQPEFKAILFIPKMDDTKKNPTSIIKLYGSGVFIMDNCEDLVPEFLSFVSGIVDSESISSKMLQGNKTPEVIRKNLVRKCIELFFEIAENKEDYNMFYKAFSRKLKFGLIGDAENRENIAQLLRYRSTKSGDDMTSFKEYVSRMKEGESKIFYSLTGEEGEEIFYDITGEGNKAEWLEENGHEVLYMKDALDWFVVYLLRNIEGRKLVRVVSTNETALVQETRDLVATRLGEADVDMPALEEADADADGSKMEEVD